MTPSNKFTFDFLKIAENFSDFLSFALIISSDESQGKAQFSVRTSYHVENRFFSTDENFNKSPHYIDFLPS